MRMQTGFFSVALSLGVAQCFLFPLFPQAEGGASGPHLFVFGRPEDPTQDIVHSILRHLNPGLQKSTHNEKSDSPFSDFNFPVHALGSASPLFDLLAPMMLGQMMQAHGGESPAQPMSLLVEMKENVIVISGFIGKDMSLEAEGGAGPQGDHGLSVRVIHSALVISGQHVMGPMRINFQRNFRLPDDADKSRIAVTYSALTGQIHITIHRQGTGDSPSDQSAIGANVRSLLDGGSAFLAPAPGVTELTAAIRQQVDTAPFQYVVRPNEPMVDFEFNENVREAKTSLDGSSLIVTLDDGVRTLRAPLELLRDFTPEVLEKRKCSIPLASAEVYYVPIHSEELVRIVLVATLTAGSCTPNAFQDFGIDRMSVVEEYGVQCAEGKLTGSRAVRIHYSPHCNGTHLECIAHVLSDDLCPTLAHGRRLSLADALLNGTDESALLVSVTPERLGNSGGETYPVGESGDWVITKRSIEQRIGDQGGDPCDSLIIRIASHFFEWSADEKEILNWPYFSLEAAALLHLSFRHVRINSPSIERKASNGGMWSHCVFFGIDPHRSVAAIPALHKDGQLRTEFQRTLGEMFVIPPTVRDGVYTLVCAFLDIGLDCAPCVPLLYEHRG